MNARPPDLETRACVTGWGQHDTHAPVLSDGRPNPHPSEGTPYAMVGPAAIAQMVRNPPPPVPKDRAQWFIPSTYGDHDARAHDVQRERGRFVWLALDIDKGNLPLEAPRDALRTVCPGASFLINSTSSATAENRKWRGLVPLAAPLAGADYADTAEAFFGLLEGACAGLSCDRALTRPAQPIYLPNPLSGFYAHHIERAGWLALCPSHPIIQRREERRQREAAALAAAEECQRQRRAQRLGMGSGDASPIDAFNDANAVSDLLARYGYTPAGNGRDWRSPHQTSGSFATRDCGHYWISLSGTDGAAGLGAPSKGGARFGDAFDLFCHFDHGGNVAAAVAAYGAELRSLALPRINLAPAARPVMVELVGSTEPTDDGPNDGGAPEPRESGEGAGQGDAGGADPVGYVKGGRNGTRPVWCMENACLVLERSEYWANVLGFNVETGLLMLLQPVPGSKVPRSTFKPRQLADSDVTAALRWFNRNGFPDATRAVLQDAIEAVARQTELSPVRHYLEGLAWDGAPRIGDWLATYGGADPDPLTAQMGRKWLVSAVARALNPGCKADHALVLEGAQGAGKSTALRLLAGDDAFLDGLPDMHSKDAAVLLRGKWIVEIAELVAMRRSADVEMVKAYLTRTADRFRPPYGRCEVVEPRRCVFAATTNRSDWQPDETGGRRFWPVRVGRFDLDALRRDRDQLWAEAVAAWRAGETWWLDEAGEADAAVRVAARGADDPWAAGVQDAVLGKSEVSTREVLSSFGIEVERQTKSDAMRVAQILARSGWARDGSFTSGPNRNSARYRRRAVADAEPPAEPSAATS